VVIEFPDDAPGAMYEQAKTAYENSQKNYERAKALLEAGETAKANFDAAEAKYRVDKSNYETQKQLIFIEAPYDGVITEIKVNEKDNVQDKTALFSIAQLNKVTAKVWANEEEIKIIRKGMPAFIENEGKKHEGSVTEVAISADPKTQAFYVETEFVNSSMELKSGVTADIKIRVYENRNAIVIPRNIINHDGAGSFIFTNANGSASKQYIKTGYENDLNVEVIDGLETGQSLIIKGAATLTSGKKIKVVQ
ncbi:MAG: efflux RND transporter periplasmic adaptor subunit, partial [Melioribacteraceae bacterium]